MATSDCNQRFDCCDCDGHDCGCLSRGDWEVVTQAHMVVAHGRRVMQMLEEYGGSIVPHLIDTDDNPGEFFRQSLTNLEKALRPRAQHKEPE